MPAKPVPTGGLALKPDRPSWPPCAPCPKTEAGTEESPGGGSEQRSQPPVHTPNSWGTLHTIYAWARLQQSDPNLAEEGQSVGPRHSKGRSQLTTGSEPARKHPVGGCGTAGWAAGGQGASVWTPKGQGGAKDRERVQMERGGGKEREGGRSGGR